MPLDPKTADLMLTDFGAWENTLDDNQRQQLETTFKYEPDRGAAQKRFASVAFVAANTGQDVEDVSRRFEDYYMHAYARDEKGLGIVGGVKDTNEFHGLLIKRANDNIIKAEKVNQARLTGRESGLSGASMPSELARFQVAYPDATEDEKLAFADTLFQASVKALPYRKLIKEASSKLGKEMESNIPSTGTFQEVASQLLSVPENDRPMVISMIGASGGATAQERAAYLSKLAGAMGRMTESVAASSLNAASDAALYGLLSPLEGQEPDTVMPTSGDDEFRILTQQIRQMADAEIAPIKGDGWWSQTGIDVARMAPQMVVTLANPAIGMAANTAYFRDTVAAQAKSEDPSLSYKQAAAIGDVSAPFNAAIETVTALIPFGKIKMPFLQKWLSTATTTIAGTARKFVVRGALGVASEVGEEMAQAIIPLWTQDALAALNKDRSEVDWQRRMPNFSQIAQQTWGPALVFGIVGGGVVSIKDIKNGRALASDVDMMVATGINPETAVKIKAASDAQDYNAADSLFRAEFVSETKASKPDIEAATERLKARFKAQENVEALTETTSPEYTASVTRTPSGWQVTTGDGTIIPAETAEGANRIYNGIRQSGSLKEAQVFAETLDAAYASGMARGAAVNLTGETVTSNSRTGLVTAVRIDENKAPIPGSERYFGPGALDTIHKEAEVAGFKSGTQNVSFHINGSNEAFPSRVADTAKGIWRMINIFKSKKDGLPMITTFLHEDIESKFRLGLANGAWSKEDARTAFRALAPAFANIAEPVGKSADEVASMSKASRQKYEEDLDAKKLEYEWVKNVRKIVDGNMDDTLVRETFSEMYVRNAYALDRRGRNTGLPPGQISRALEAAVVGANTNEEASALVRIIAVFRALSAHLKAVFNTVKAMVKARDNGTIGEDWDAFVNKVVGIDEVKRDEGLAVQEALAMLPRDVTNPEQMTPNEWKSSLKEKQGNIYSGAVAEYQQKAGLNYAIYKRRSNVSSEAVAYYGMTKMAIDNGYVKKGELYVWRGDEAQAILEDSDMPFSISPVSTVSVPTSDIDTIPEDLARAEADMKAGGKDWAAKVDLSQPVGVYRGEDGRLKLFDGHHRWLAARERGEPLQVRESVMGQSFSISPVNRVSKIEFDDKLEELQTLDLEDDQFTMPKFNAAKDNLVDTIVAGEAHLMVRGKDAISPFGAHELFIVDNDDTPIGFVRLTKSPKQISINMIHIDEDYRGRGIGSEFYRYWLDKGVSIKSDKEITDGTAAIYQKLASEGYGMDIQDGRAVLMPRLNEDESRARFSISPVTGNNLVTVHNLSENNLRHALKVGGLAVPSLAVVRTDVSNFDAFGEITLIARPDLVDPQRNKDSKVFNADVYSPRYPTVKTIFSRRELDKVGPLFKGYYDELEKVTKKSYSWSVGNLVETLADEGFDRLQSNHLAQYAYLRDAGLIEPPASEVDGYDFSDSLRKQTNELRTEIVNFVQSKVDGAGVKYEEKIPDGYTNSGKRKFLPHDLDTVVKIMTRKLKDGEGFNYGVPSIRAANAKPFKTLKAIQDSRDKIITSEEMEALKKEVNDEFIVLAESALAARKTKPSFGGLDAVSDDMKALVQGDNSWIREMYGDSPVVQDMKTFVAKLRDMPTEYFEAKVKRAVQLQEFEAAVVPSGTSEDLKAALKKKGIAVREYEAGNGASRKSAIESASSEFNATFSISPIRNLNELSDQVERQFAENPVEALEVKSRMIRQFAKYADKWSNERWTPQGNKIRPISDKRTVKSLDKEQAMRQAQREVELVNEGIDKLTPETLMAYSEGVGVLEDDPLVDKMLNENGRLMSKATAAREGRNIKDQYDDLNWIPPQWYSNGRTIKTVVITRKDGSSESFPSAKVPAEVKAAIKSGEVKVKINKVTIPAVGGIMPDVMANNLGFDTASEMWAALESSIKSHRNAKEGYAKAEAAVKAVEKAAFEQARKEAQAWRDEADAMQKEDWSPKESLVRDLITLEAIRAMFPQEIRDKIGGFVTLARKASESARLKVLQKQLERGQVLLEKHLKEQYNVSLLKMLDKAAPVGKPGEVKKSKFIVTVQDELDAISEIVGMDSDDVTESITTNEAAIISAQTPEAADVALTRLNLLELFGGILDLKRTSSQEMEVAHEYLAKLMKQGREARKIIDEARSAKVKEMVAMAKADAFKGQTGPETTQAARAKAAKESGRAMLRKFFGELSGFDAVLRDAFGPKSETARSFSERFTLNSNDFEDVQNERRTRFRDFARELYQTKLGAKINQKLIKLERIEKNSSVTYLKNREVKTHKFTEADAAKIVADPKAFGFTDKDAAAISEEIQAIQDSGGRRKVFTYDQIINDGDRVEIPLSQMDAVYISMALRQPGILEQQERHGYDQQTVDELDKYLTDEAKSWRRWMQTEYDAEYQRANEVYMRMFNARMPMIMFYAPLLKNHQGQQAILDPLNTGISSNSANPGSIKTRKGRTSSLRIESALTVFWAHFNQMEYWIANAEYLRDVQAVLLNPEVRESVVASHGEDGMATISAWIQLQMSRGVGKAALATAGNKIFRNVKTGLTMKALALSYTTALKTLPSVFYSLGETHMSKWPSALVSGMTHWNRLWKTNIIQRRLDIGGMPELRDLGSSAMPMSWMNQLIKYGSAPAMYADAVFTTFSAAMAYGVNYDEAIRQGASEDLAHNHAEERTALIVSRTAQPENWTQKSLLENDVGAFGSMFTLFMSDPRQKMALTGAALNQFRKGNVTGEEAARKFLAYWVIPGIMFQLANAIGRSLFKGDDDEWEVVDFATAALVGQLQGLVLLGSGVESIFSAAIAAAAEKITGEEVKRKPFWNSSKNPLDQAAQDLIKSAENLNDTDKDVFEKTWEVIKSAGMLTTWLNPAGAVPATVERVIKDTTNLFYGAEE